MPKVKKRIKSKIKSKQKNLSQKEIDSYAHKGAKRKNNPPVGLVSSATDKLNGRTTYQHDPHIDPYLSWAGKAEGLSFEVQNVSLHVHERIDPKRITQSFLKRKEKSREVQLSLFDQPDNEPPLHKAVDFYRHEQDWTNRLIAGDSLLVMNSLLRKEGMAGKVQMVYIDPPYGIKYNSNFQPFINKRDVKDGNDGDLPAEPEMIQAFRDTWELVSLENYDGDLSPSKIIALDDLTSQEATRLGSFKITFQKQEFIPPINRHWRTTQDGIDVLITKNRLYARNGRIFYKRYLSDQPVSEFNNFWFDTVNSFERKIYVVQTNQLVVQRCMLMTTDPGDLVFDPTCGSGTTAFVAEQWGRRWITCDTSRVAVTLAKQRLMTAKFDYYELAHPNEGVRSGFKYKTVPHVTLGSIANNEPAKEETLYDKPFIEKDKVRVTGPFTVEAVPSLRVKPFDGKEPKMEVKGNELARTGETGNQAQWRDELKATGIRTIGGKIIPFSRVEPMVATRFLHAEGEILEDGTTKEAYISFGPDYGALEQRQIEEALKEARSLKVKPDFVVFAAFHFDPEAAKDVDQIEWKGVTILKAQMSVDLLTQDLRKKRSSNQSYWLIGQPDVEVKKVKDGQYKVVVHGFDYYDPIIGNIDSGGKDRIAMWFLDTDYDERSLMPDQVFFPMSDSSRDWTKLAKALNGEVDEELIETFRGTESLSFESGNNRKIAVKIIDNRGIESFVVKRLE